MWTFLLGCFVGALAVAALAALAWSWFLGGVEMAEERGQELC